MESMIWMYVLEILHVVEARVELQFLCDDCRYAVRLLVSFKNQMCLSQMAIL